MPMKLDYDNDSGTTDNATFSLGTDATLTINGTTVTSKDGEEDGLETFCPSTVA